jgi:hypothetical protein
MSFATLRNGGPARRAHRNPIVSNARTAMLLASVLLVAAAQVHAQVHAQDQWSFALALDTDELQHASVLGRLETDLFLATLAFGYRFGRAGSSTLDVLLGARHLALDGKLTLQNIGRFRQDQDFTDLVIVLRPSWALGTSTTRSIRAIAAPDGTAHSKA